MDVSAVVENRSAQVQNAEFRQVLSANHTHADYLGVYIFTVIPHAILPGILLQSTLFLQGDGT